MAFIVLDHAKRHPCLHRLLVVPRDHPVEGREHDHLDSSHA